MIGSHEDDVKMTEGLSGLKEQLSIGYMEVGSDLTERLPVSERINTVFPSLV